MASFFVKSAAALAFLALASLSAQAAGTAVLMEAPTCDEEAGPFEALVRRLAQDAAAAAAPRLGTGYRVAFEAGAEAPDCRITCFATGSAPLRISLIAAGPGEEGRRQAATYSFRGEPEASRVLPALAAGLVISVMEGTSRAGQDGEPGVAVAAELSLEPFSALFGLDPPLRPYVYDLATAPGGPAWAAVLGGVAACDPFFRLSELRRPEGQGPYFAAIKVAATAAGSVLAADSQGGLWRLRRDSAAERLRSGSGPALRLAAFPDGSLLVAEAGAKALGLVEGKRRSDFLLAGAKVEPWVPAAVDAEGRAWTYDYESGLIRLCLADGSLVDAIKPVLPEGAAPTAILPLSGGDFVLVTQGGLSGHDRGGRPRWSLAAIAPAIDPEGAGPVIAGAAADPADGSIWLADTMAGKIWRLVDLDYASSRGGPGADTAALLSLNAAVAADPGSRTACEARAAFLESRKAGELAYACRLAMAERFPEDAANAGRVEAYGAAMERAALLARAKAVYGPLERLGPESARADYAAALKAFERYLAAHPEDAEAAAERDRLTRAFAERERPALPPPGPAPRIVSASVSDLFPALMAAYGDKAAGSCVVEYLGAAPASAVTLRASIKDYSDWPAEARVEGPIAPGSRLELPIRLQLNRSVLALEEDLPVQVRLEASFALPGGSEARAEMAAPALLRRRSALVWTEIGALASFVTPNEETVSAFALAAAAKAGALPWNRALSKAAAVARALGSLGLAYVEDPRSPFSAARGAGAAREAADTVRFPRATLAARAGDCDDTSALLASCLEAVGVRTAIVGVPGHVLVAFDAEEEERAAWQFTGEGVAPIARGGRLWIPLESTVLSKGFAECWRSGTRAWREGEAAGSAELESLAEARASYPPLPLPSSGESPPLASASGAALLAEADGRALSAAFAAGKTDTAEDCNRAGVVAARLGDFGRAEALLGRAALLDPGAVAPRVNLYNARALGGDMEGAARALEAAIALRPGSAALERLYASCLESLGRTAEARRYADSSSPPAAPRLAEGATAGPAARGDDASGARLADWDY